MLTHFTFNDKNNSIFAIPFVEYLNNYSNSFNMYGFGINNIAHNNLKESIL
jgi:hypothetical protein